MWSRFARLSPNRLGQSGCGVDSLGCLQTDSANQDLESIRSADPKLTRPIRMWGWFTPLSPNQLGQSGCGVDSLGCPQTDSANQDVESIHPTVPKPTRPIRMWSRFAPLSPNRLGQSGCGVDSLGCLQTKQDVVAACSSQRLTNMARGHMPILQLLIKFPSYIQGWLDDSQ